jgi:hypothetical protein
VKPNVRAPEKRKETVRVKEDSMECQPTSSKVRVEDMVTTEEEKKEVEDSIPELQRTRFWDRPIPDLTKHWYRDPRLPPEWNDMVATLIAERFPGEVPQSEFRWPEDEEVSAAEEYKRPKYRQWSDPERIRLNVDEENKAGETLRAMMESQDHPKQGWTRSRPSPPKPKPDKDKGKARLTEEDIPQLRERWKEEYQDIVNGVPEERSPFRVVNHEINLIDDNKVYKYHLPRCPQSLRDELLEKIQRYLRAGWWEAVQVPYAAPLLCIPKKDGHLRTALDARQRNDNTVRDVTPLPDQELIREDVARAKYRSKIDLSDAYEQVRLKPEDVPKTVFATIFGTFVSHTMQIGDCNAPATFQRLMTTIFQPYIGRSMHVYLDDLFIFSNTIEEHERHLHEVFETLRENRLYLKWKKCELYVESVDCLGHVIDERGIHVVKDKVDSIRSWRVPQNFNDVQKFVGLVNYLAPFLPDVSTYTSPLLSIMQNGTPFHWHAIHQRCFDTIKEICASTPVLQPIRAKDNKEPIWLICDASKTGIGAVYGQGPTWQTCQPAGFLSKKFTTAQQNYAVFELETLAILEALMKWEDKLFRYRIHIITDHKALEFFKSQEKLSPRQVRWHEYMSQFDFDITYVKGESNKIADVLSRYYESDTALDVHIPSDYVRADKRIDPTGATLPKQRWK